jgi:hypothetical protein
MENGMEQLDLFEEEEEKYSIEIPLPDVGHTWDHVGNVIELQADEAILPGRLILKNVIGEEYVVFIDENGNIVTERNDG